MGQLFYFVAGEQVATVCSSTILDAWLAFTIRAKKEPIASEFRSLPIDAVSSTGEVLVTRTWQQWQEAVMRDTYGSNWREITERASELI